MIDETAKGSNDQSKDIEIQEMANEIKEELGPTTVICWNDDDGKKEPFAVKNPKPSAAEEEVYTPSADEGEVGYDRESGDDKGGVVVDEVEAIKKSSYVISTRRTIRRCRKEGRFHRKRAFNPNRHTRAR